MADVTGTDSPKIDRRKPSAIWANLRGDKCNVCLLLALYTLQSLPLGFVRTVQILVQNKHYSSYSEQAKFSLVLWPFSMKLLWAPFVDSLYVQKFGRRKSWIVPIQYILGVFFFIAGFHINDWLIDADRPNINALTLVFFGLTFLAATQDVAVDGWALNLLKRENISYASTCNGAGLSFGLLFGYILPITLLEESFCNKWLRSSPQPGGLISLQGYLYFWCSVCMVTTTLLALFKREKNCSIESSDIVHSVIKTYKLLFKVLRFPNVKKLVVMLFTVQLSFSAIDAAFKLKLIDGGVTKDEIGAIEFCFMIPKLFLPYFVIKCTSKDKSMTNYLRIMVSRLIIAVFATITVYFTPYLVVQKGTFLIMYKIVLVLVFVLGESVKFVMWFTLIAFFAKISDPKIGGTYMTLLTTVSHLGATGSVTAALWLINLLTFKRCSTNYTDVICSDKICNSLVKTCRVFVDGFYVEVCFCVVYGVIWYYTFRKSVITLESKDIKEWHLNSEQNAEVD